MFVKDNLQHLEIYQFILLGFGVFRGKKLLLKFSAMFRYW